jgi:acetyl esterase/lipase
VKSKIRKIIVSGDSAGGNLSFALVNRCIAEGIRPPDAIAVSYPATYLTTSPSPGRLCSLIDPMVNFSFLKMCSESYLKHGEEGYDGK